MQYDICTAAEVQIILTLSIYFFLAISEEITKALKTENSMMKHIIRIKLSQS